MAHPPHHRRKPAGIGKVLDEIFAGRHAIDDAGHLRADRVEILKLEIDSGAPGKRAFDVYLQCFERGLLIRTTGDTIALSPALIIEQQHVDELFGVLSQALRECA